MSFQVSPGVEVREIDLTNVVPAVSSSIGGTAGAFAWGPVWEIVTVGSEKDLVNTFGRPTDDTYKYFMPAAQFLLYTNALKVVRTNNAGMLNADTSGNGVLVKNADDYTVATLSAEYVAKYPGELGNGLKVVVCTSETAFEHSSFATYARLFDFAPGVSRYASDRGLALDTAGNNGDEMHIVVVDEEGSWTGVAGTVLEVFQGVSQARDARKDDGASNYYVDVLNRESKYIWFGSHDITLDEAGDTVAEAGAGGFTSSGIALEYLLEGGSNGTSATPTVGELQLAFDLFSDAETVDVNFLIGAEVSAADDITHANSLIAIAEGRKDVVAFLSPAVIETVNNVTAATDVKAWADGITSSSYAVLDSTALYVYDKYNDRYRWIVASGAVAGLCAYTDSVTDPWFSPAGFTRGQLRGVTKIAFNPKQADRDTLYKARVNPIVAFPGEGIVLYGDKTALKKPSAFDRINVRRLFINLEKAVATAAKFQLFEFNDEFTRAQFRNLVEPFLRDVQGRRGVTDFAVICDETNNTGEVIDSNRFVADIYIKPARSINFITLNFIATRTGVEFSEIVGQ
jgi:phage tail sheath protein FI